VKVLDYRKTFNTSRVSNTIRRTRSLVLVMAYMPEPGWMIWQFDAHNWTDSGIAAQ